MAVRMNIALRNKILDNVFNSGAGISMLDSGVAEFRTGTQPATGDTAASGTIVASVSLPADAMAAAASGSIGLSGTWQDLSADNAGLIGYVRFRDAADTYRIDVDVTATGGGGLVTVDNPTLTAGQQFTVTSMSFTV